MFRITSEWKNATREPKEGAREERCVSLCLCVSEIIVSERATGAPSAAHQRASPNENATLFPLVKAPGNISK